MQNGTFEVNKDAHQVTMVYTFDAPRELVWKTINDPALVPQWWGPKQYTTVVDKMELKVGGVWRFIQKDTDGNEFAFNGVYKEIEPPHKVVQTFEFEPMAGHILTETMTLEEVDGKTIFTQVSEYASLADLEGMIATGMEGGARETMQRLGELLATVS